MLALIGSLAGFISSFMPELFTFVKDKRDKAHELEIIRLQIESSKIQNSSSLDEVKINNEYADNKLVYNHAKPIGVSWVDALSSSVRPFITYSFFLLYIGIKVLIFFNYEKGISMPIWTDEDQGIFCAVIGFWFGHRAFGKKRSYL